MHRLQRSVLLPYSARDVSDLVRDVERYAEFLPWCHASEIVQREESETTARLVVGARGRRETLVTRNRERGEAIDIDLVSGPFRAFQGSWHFKALGDAGCRVSLTLEFEFESRLLSFAAGPFLDRVADELLDAFAERAARVCA